MDKNFNVNGSDNKIIFTKDGVVYENATVEGLNITITGNNNTVEIELPCKFIKTSIIMDGDNNFIQIKSTRHRYIRQTVFGLEGGSKIFIGSGLSTYRDINFVAKNGKNIYVGDECMFARNIMVRNNDGHIILDKNTGELLNPPEDIHIGDNVWIAMNSIILKGAVIPKGSVVGAMALVNGKFDEENILIAGVPAKKVRSNIEWRREDFAMYMKH